MRKQGQLVPAVVALPTRPSSEYTSRARRAAIEQTFLGQLRLAADLTRAAVTENGVFSGLVNTISHGILGLPLNLQGDPEMVAALQDAEGSPGDFGRMFPESEAAQVFTDGIILGVGLGQLVELPGSGAWDVLRPYGARAVPRMRRWDPRWLRQDPYSRRWYLMTQSGEIEVVPGDGEWVLFCPYGEIEPWLYAPWVYITLAFIFGRDSTYDRQRHSEVLSPARVMRATKSTTKEARDKTKRKLQQMRRDNYFVLPQEWIYEVVESTGKITDIYAAVIAWSERQVEVGLTGQTVTTEGTKGFSEGTIHQRLARDRMRFYAGTWFRCVREQALVYWALDNFGTDRAPTGGYNVDPPEDILAKATALDAWGKALVSLADGLGRHGAETEPSWVVEEAAKWGVRARVKPAGSAPASKLDFAPSDLVTFVKMNEARQSQGLTTIDNGELMVSVYNQKFGANVDPAVSNKLRRRAAVTLKRAA